jgi:hypothetical protein
MSVTIDCGEGRHGLCVGYGESPYLFPQLAGDTFTCACHCHKFERQDTPPQDAPKEER